VTGTGFLSSLQQTKVASAIEQSASTLFFVCEKPCNWLDLSRLAYRRLLFDQCTSGVDFDRNSAVCVFLNCENLLDRDDIAPVMPLTWSSLPDCGSGSGLSNRILSVALSLHVSSFHW
jgi:hypothetical protein